MAVVNRTLTPTVTAPPTATMAALTTSTRSILPFVAVAYQTPTKTVIIRLTVLMAALMILIRLLPVPAVVVGLGDVCVRTPELQMHPCILVINSVL